MEKLQITQLKKAEPTSEPKLDLAVEPEHLTLSLYSGILNSVTHQGWIDNVNGGGEAMRTGEDCGEQENEPRFSSERQPVLGAAYSYPERPADFFSKLEIILSCLVG